jgi:hypothetical protein
MLKAILLSQMVLVGLVAQVSAQSSSDIDVQSILDNWASGPESCNDVVIPTIPQTAWSERSNFLSKLPNYRTQLAAADKSQLRALAEEWISQNSELTFASMEGAAVRLSLSESKDDLKMEIKEPNHTYLRAESSTYLSPIEVSENRLVLQMPLDVNSQVLREAVKFLNPNNEADIEQIRTLRIYEIQATAEGETKLSVTTLLVHNGTGKEFILEQEDFETNPFAAALWNRSGDQSGSYEDLFQHIYFLFDTLKDQYGFTDEQLSTSVQVPGWMAKLFRLFPNEHILTDSTVLVSPEQLEAAQFMLPALKATKAGSVEDFRAVNHRQQASIDLSRMESELKQLKNQLKNLRAIKRSYFDWMDLAKMDPDLVVRLEEIDSAIARDTNLRSQAYSRYRSISTVEEKKVLDDIQALLPAADLEERNRREVYEGRQRGLNIAGWMGGEGRAKERWEEAAQALDKLILASREAEKAYDEKRRLENYWLEASENLDIKVSLLGERERLVSERVRSLRQSHEAEIGMLESELKLMEIEIPILQTQIDESSRVIQAHIEQLDSTNTPVISGPNGERLFVLQSSPSFLSLAGLVLGMGKPEEALEYSVRTEDDLTEVGRFYVAPQVKKGKLELHVISRSKGGFLTGKQIVEMPTLSTDGSGSTRASLSNYLVDIATNLAVIDAAIPHRELVHVRQDFGGMVNTLNRLGWLNPEADLNHLKAQIAFLPSLPKMSGNDLNRGAIFKNEDGLIRAFEFQESMPEALKGIVSRHEFGENTLFTSIDPSLWATYSDVIFHEYIHLLDKEGMLRAENATSESDFKQNTEDREELFEAEGLESVIEHLRTTASYQASLDEFIAQDAVQIRWEDGEQKLRAEFPEMEASEIEKRLRAEAQIAFERKNYGDNFQNVKSHWATRWAYLTLPYEQTAWKAQISYLKNEKGMSLEAIADHLHKLSGRSGKAQLDPVEQMFIETWYAED